MSRIISDAYIKENKRIWGADPTTEFNQRILAVNNMYAWLYNKGLLEKVCFEFKDYADGVEFALDVKDLEPYRSEMEACGIDGAALAVRHIFDEPYTPCTYSGAIELGWTMQGYRSVDGMVGRSWECGLSQGLNTEGIYAVAKVREEQGVKAAVKEMFAQLDWEPTLPEQKLFKDALKHSGQDVDTDIEYNERIQEDSQAIACNGVPIFDGYGGILSKDDAARLEEMWEKSENYNSNHTSISNNSSKVSLDQQIRSASTRTSEAPSSDDTQVKESSFER